MCQRSARYDQEPFYLLKPEAAIARTLVDLDLRRALAR
jgi:hypothetical protein